MEEERIDTTGPCEQIMVEIWNYLASKFEDLPEHEIQEISAYLANRFGVTMMDNIRTRDEEWSKHLNSVTRYWEKRYKKLIDENDKLMRKLRRIQAEKGIS